MISISVTQESLANFIKEQGINISNINNNDGKKLNLIDYDNPEFMNKRNNLDPGKYYLKDGNLVEGSPETRQIALYSNWCANNADPQDLLRL